MNTLLLMWLLAVLALALGTAQLYLAVAPAAPLAWLYWHARLRKPLLWTVAVVGLLLIAQSTQSDQPLWPLLFPFGLQLLSLFFAYRLHQETIFRADNNPAFTRDLAAVPVEDERDVALIEVDGELRAYPLDYVAHHHVVNDRFADKLIALSYCPMCRTIIAFDTTEIGPLYVASFKNGNLILADRKTGTFFQQATFESAVGPLHPHTLAFYPSQIMPWGAARQLTPAPAIVAVTAHDLRRFELPIPGLWQRVLRSELTPGIAGRSRDRRLPARTRVIGVAQPGHAWAYPKADVLGRGSVYNQTGDFFLLAIGDTVSGFRARLDGQPLQLTLTEQGVIHDGQSGTTWDLRGRYLAGPHGQDLIRVPVSDEYWFAWSNFHPHATLVRLDDETPPAPVAAPVLQA